MLLNSKDKSNSPARKLGDASALDVAFAPYIATLHSILTQALQTPRSRDLQTAINAALDGQPSSQLKCIALPVRKSVGAFFTPSGLAAEAVSPWRSSLARGATVLDPTCGAGDLLCACARHLPVTSGFESTLSMWGEWCCGSDVSQAVVDVAKMRLTLLALQRTSSKSGAKHPDIASLFPRIAVGDGLKALGNSYLPEHVVVNPPFFKAAVLKSCDWASGSVSFAALFIDACVTTLAPGTDVIAILPDVLRTGTYYNKWRATIAKFASIREIHNRGRFDSSADVDVFTLRLRVGGPIDNFRAPRWIRTRRQRVTLGDHFVVQVGPVVPHRHPKKGPWCSYLTSRDAPKWGRVRTGAIRRRRFAGRLFQPPFLVVKRTSSPSDKNRASTTLVTGVEPVAVENHLLVLLPKDGMVTSCQRGIAVLRATETDIWFNERIRCRHLTVTALRDVPWPTQVEIT